MKLEPVLELSKALISCPSITPNDCGALNTLSNYLKSLGFACKQKLFEEHGTPSIGNLYAKIGSEPPNICFAGHTDVVPVGNEKEWISKPFEPQIRDGILFGRGAADMKCAIAAFAVAAGIYKNKIGSNFKGSISFLITGDEEGPAINGTIKMLKWLKEKGESIDHCLVGEPTCSKSLGDTIKIGRRGSLNATFKAFGTQGHVAYPLLAQNPVPHLLNFLTFLDSTPLDNGNGSFQPSNLEITTIDVGNSATNIIPETASARLNIRFNNLHTGKSLIAYLDSERKKIPIKIEMDARVSGEAFITSPGVLINLLSKSIKTVAKIEPELSTSGGTSDARFIKNICPVIEFGMINASAHKINEHAAVEDILKLTNIYVEFLISYFKHTS